MKSVLLAIVVTGLGLLMACGPAKVEPKIYAEDWDSLATHNKEPEWFKDAKLGIYFHWGPYSVPAFKTEWYPCWMYHPDREGWGSGVYQHHVETYGDPSEFNYHDFVPMFKAEHFDPADWADLFQSAGAKFAGPVAQHHDGFAMWASEVNPWNAGDMGPQRDILGELYKELEARDMRTIATFHHARNLQRYATDTANWGGRNSHYRYHPDYATSSTDPLIKYLYGNIPEEEFNDYWLNQVTEVVDKYEPDMIWFDSWRDQIPDARRRKMVAHQFNAGSRRGEETVVLYKQEDIPRNVGVLDIEQGGMVDMPEDYWMTDITISYGSWSYIQDQTYKDPTIVIRNMIDVWSKKGVVLLNVSPRADGVIPEDQRETLAGIGEWLNTYGEAVYGTRTHSVYGYGSAEIEEGHFGGQSATQKYTASDIRFTTSKDGKNLYVFTLGMPEPGTELTLKHICEGDFQGRQVKNVSMLGSDAKLGWTAGEGLLKLTTPEAAEMNEIANVFKVTLK